LPAIVRSRFDKLVASKTYVEAARADPLVLYRIAGGSAGVDDGIERYFRPRVVVPVQRKRASGERAAEADAATELTFYDRREQQLILGGERIALPAELNGDFAQLQRGRFGDGGKYDVAAARMADSYFSRGAQMSQLVDYRPWRWSFHDATTGAWTQEATRWTWDQDVPLLADLEGNGVAELVAWNRSSGAWWRGDRALGGIVMKGSANAVPVIGRFSRDAPATLAIYETDTGTWTMLPAGADPKLPPLNFRFGIVGDILAPGDYDGDGVDEVMLFRRSDSSWNRRDAGGRLSTWTFGSPTAIPVPTDYDGDGALDLAYWEPAEREIRISLDHGQSIARTVVVPPDALPAFVNMY
jgi:hypothetical protein